VAAECALLMAISHAAQAACTAAASRTLWSFCAAWPAWTARAMQRSTAQTAARTLLSETLRGGCSTGGCGVLPSAALAYCLSFVAAYTITLKNCISNWRFCLFACLGPTELFNVCTSA